MFATLLETRALRPRRTASSITSVVLHGVIIAGATIATARDVTTVAPPEPPIIRVDFSPPPTPPKPVNTRPPQDRFTSVVPAPVIDRLNVPVVVPVGIPPIDFASPATPVDFRPGPLATAGLICERNCTSAPLTNDAGHAIWSSNDLAMRLANDPVPPRYPEVLRRAGVEGDVVVKFVVDTTGAVDMQSVEIVRSTHDAFTVAARESLARLRFFPSTVGERKVRALAMMPFRFTLK